MLAKSRTEAAVAEFLAHFAPERKQSGEEYWIPQHAETPQQIFQETPAVITYCCHHSTETQSIYWRRIGGGEPAHLMVFFTSDAQLIFGLSVSENVADQFLAELRRHAHSNIGYITFESPPPETVVEFVRLRANHPPMMRLAPLAFRQWSIGSIELASRDSKPGAIAS